jgi:hypothetical protein
MKLFKCDVQEDLHNVMYDMKCTFLEEKVLDTTTKNPFILYNHG